VTDPLTVALVVCALLATACWVLSIATDNYSQGDRLWSIAPPFYALLFAGWSGFAIPRVNLMAALAVLWGARLTWNFARKGGYRPGGEDHRWPEVRRALGPIGFQVLNLTFIAPFQNLLLLLLALPAYAAWRVGPRPLGWLDLVAAAAFALFWLGEAVADQQQWRFQTAKRAAGAAATAGFLSSGLFRYSRHPNFFCEIAMWWCFYLFAVAATGTWLDPSIAGAALLTLLFQGSTHLTERITLGKYPRYAQYQRTTSRLVPWRPAPETRRPGR
jgi:steroid 5-alpha reductase family enzyme